jgi:hypothetical protein
MKAIKKLYLATTERDDVFKVSKSIQKKNLYIYDEHKHVNIDNHKK